MEHTETTSSSPIEKSTLVLGDIISIRAPSNADIHEHVFYIYYLDEQKMKLFDMSSKVNMTLSHENYLEDESIVGIDLLYRNLQSGFARQNGLLPGVWVNAHFGGDMPSVISGEITNLEEDMIEITTYPGYRVIYIDFAYCGLPEDLSLDKIVVSDRPAALKNISLRDLTDSMEPEPEVEEEATAEYDESNGEFILHIPDSIVDSKPDHFNDQIEEIIEPFEEGQVLGEETVLMEVLENERRYGLDAQLSDLMGKLVSRIPMEERTPKALDKMRLIVARYKDLREKFSTFDANHHVVEAKQTDFMFKPSIQHILNADMNMGWLLPVVYEPRELVNDSICKQDAKNQRVDEYGPYAPLEYSEISVAKDVDCSTFINERENVPENINRKIESFGNYVDNYVNYKYSPEQNAYDAKMRLMDTVTGHVSVKPTKHRFHFYHTAAKIPTQVMLDSSAKNRLESSVATSTLAGKHLVRDQKKYVIKMYLPGETRLVQNIAGKTRRKLFVREPVTDPERLVVRSFLTMPESFFSYQYVQSPSTSIHTKSCLAQHPPYLFRALKSQTDVCNIEIQDLEKEIEYFDYSTGTGTGTGTGTKEPFLHKITHYTVNEKAVLPSMTKADVAHGALNAVIPRTRTLMKWLEPKLKHVYSYIDMVKHLEPFGIYEWNITFRQYMEARYFIKQQLKAIHAQWMESAKEYREYKNTHFNAVVQPVNRVYDMVKRDPFTNTMIKNVYLLGKDEEEEKDNNGTADPIKYMFPSEYIAKMESLDGANVYSKLIQNLVLDHVSPNEIMDRLEKADIDTSDKSAFRKSKCLNRSIAKKYEAESALQKDNGATDPIYFDKDYDDTPYSILQTYKKERARFKEPKEFVEFLEDKLIREHDCPAELAPGLAATLIAGKKEVGEGEYAMLYVTPKMVRSSAEIESMSEREKRDVVAEATARAQIRYYKRVKNQWIHDKSVDETSFVDNNTLFCNLAAECTKQDSTGQCLPNVSASIQMRLAKRKKMMDEFDKRAAITAEEMKRELHQNILTKFKIVSRFAAIREIKHGRQNAYCYELGKYVSRVNEQTTVSPYAAAFQRILGMADFVKKQDAIVAVVFHFCVEATETQDPHWYYCKETGAKLVPVSIHRLAEGFRRGTYVETLDEVCREYGVLSDDGNFIEDRYTGFFLKNREFSTDEEFDDEGQQIQTRSVVKDKEADIATLVQQALNAPNKHKTSQHRVFADKTMQMAYNVYFLLSRAVGIDDDSVAEREIEEFVLRTTIECMYDDKIVFLTEAEYVAKMMKKHKKSGDKEKDVNVAASFAPFETYRNQTLVILVAASLHVSIQTLIPSFKTKTHYSGCVQSFEGYPLDPNPENAKGVKYIACVLDKIKRGAEQPWKSMESIGADSMAKRMRMYIGEYLLKRGDIDALYAAKREYTIQHPEETVPPEVGLGRWTQFLPPLVAVSLKKPPAGITAEFEKDTFDAMRKGSADQHASIRVLESKLIQISYGLFDAIQSIVATKQATLTTAGGRAFLENTCCNEPGAEKQPLVYFLKQNPNLELLLKKAARVALVLSKIQKMNRAPLFFAPESSRITYPPLPDNIIEDTIYQAYISYCKFDSDELIPRYLETVCSEKPKYDRSLSLKEKIQYLKKHGKDYGLDQFYHLMRLVNKKNEIRLSERQIEYEPTHSIGGFNDVLRYFDMDKPSPVVESNLVTLLKNAIARFDGKTTYTDASPEERKLKSYLLHVNREMGLRIESFITSNAVVYTSAEMNQIRKLVQNSCRFSFAKNLREVSQQIENSMHRIARVYASCIVRGHYGNIVENANWGFAPNHAAGLVDEKTQFLKTYLYPHIYDDSSDSSKEYRDLIQQAMRDVRDLFVFIEQIPIFESRNGAHYLFDDETTRLLLEYTWLSTMYQFVMLAVDPAYNRIQMVPIGNYSEEDEDDNGRVDGRRMATSEVELTQIENMDLRHKVAKMVTAFLLAETKIRNAFNMDYDTIMEKTERLKYGDKKRITDYLTNMTQDERRVEKNLKKKKLGRWDVGLKSSLFKYDKTTWEKEKNELQNEMAGLSDLVYEVPAEMDVDVEQLEREEEQEADRDAYDEANDISGLGEDYMDGVYYEEDAEREDEW